MKNKLTKESVFKSKGFYVALYSSLGVVVVAAAVIALNNPQLKPAEPPASAESTVDFSQMEQVNQSSVEMGSYLTPKDTQAKQKSNTTPQSETPVPTARVISPAEAAATPQPTQAPPEPEKRETGVAEPAEYPEPDESAVVEPEPIPQPLDEQSYAEELGEPVFNYYTGDTRMNWPVVGEIVMDYSMDRTIYDRTLDQYRTNDTLCIAAPGGTPVKAAADGVVLKVENTRAYGNTVVIDNGNGWTTTYCQLQDGVLVAEGEVVKEGQVLGGVGSPSIYSVLIGNHLGFKITKDDQLVDPKMVLAQ